MRRATHPTLRHPLGPTPVNSPVDNAVALAWVLIVIAIVAAIVIFQAHQTKTHNETYRRVARRFGGRATEGSGFARPTLSFEHQGAWVLVDVHATGGKHKTYYTQVHIAWPDKATRCEVYPERFTSRLGKMLGMQDVEIGSPEFDRDFIITGSSARDLRELLAPPVQHSIYNLRRLFYNDHIYVSISSGKMLVKKLGLIRQEAQLEELILAALELYDRALGTKGDGIEIVAASVAAATGAEVVCQVCGETIERDAVHCRRCKTPHHEDCWEYFGGCSTFGCGEKRHAPPKR